MAGILRAGSKFCIIGGTIYYTSKLGVWNDSSHSEKIYQDLYQFLVPYVQDIPVEVPQLPHITDITSTAKNYWNCGVLKTGKFMLELPELGTSVLKEGYNTLLNQINSPSGSS